MVFLPAQAVFSESEIGRDASEMSVSPLQNFLNPPPVPEIPTEPFTFGCASAYSDAAALVSGPTVDEPSTRTHRSAPSYRCRIRSVVVVAATRAQRGCGHQSGRGDEQPPTS